MRKLILATVAAASLLSAGAIVTQPASAAVRCWWSGGIQHCVYTHPRAWRWGYRHHPWWWYRGY